MPYQDDDLYDEEFDFVDDLDDEDAESSDLDADGSELEDDSKTEEVAEDEGKSSKSKRGTSKSKGKSSKNSARESKPESRKKAKEDEVAPEDPSDSESGKEKQSEEPEIPTDHVVHLYEYGQFQRTLPREFTASDAEAFAVEFNRTGKPHSRHAQAAPKDSGPDTST